MKTNTKPLALGLVTSLGLTLSATSTSIACGGYEGWGWSIDWVEPATEAMELFIEAAMERNETSLVEHASTAQAPVTIAGLTIDASRLFEKDPTVDLKWTAVPETRYVVERSANLDSWTKLTDNHVHSGYGSTTTFTDHSVDGSDSNALYYRVRAD